MRRVSVLVPALALLASALLLVGSPASAAGIAHYRFLPAQVFGSVAVGMPDERTVQVQHYDATTQAWDAPATVYRTHGRVTCGAIEGRAASPTGPGVVLLLECDTPYYDDQAPAHSVGLVSADGRSWAHRRLPGEAYRAPAISPSATYAAWLAGGSGEYVEWSAGTGFAKPARTSYRYDQGMETPVVDDTGTVHVIGPEESAGACVVGIHSRDLSGALTHTTLPVDPGCTEGDFENVDALTVLGGGTERASQFTVARAAVGAPWAITRGAPDGAPGLVRYGYARQRITTVFLYSSTPGSPIVAIGSPDRHHVFTQVFDDAAQTWRAQTEVHASGRRCRDGFFDLPETALYAFALRCGKGYVVLVGADATSWTVRAVGRRPFTISDLGAALPGRSGTTVVQGTDVREFPATTDGPCDVVQAGRPGELVRLHGAKNRWPARVQVSTGGAFRTVSKARRFDEPCRQVIVFPDRLDLNGPHHARDGQLVLSRGTWRFRYLKADAYEPR